MQHFSNQKVTPITVTPRGELYHQIMYRIRKDKNGATLVFRACSPTERVQGFNRSLGNQRTLAAHAMLEHFHEEPVARRRCVHGRWSWNGCTRPDMVPALVR